MDTIERVKRGLSLLRNGPENPEFLEYFKSLKNEDMLAHSLLEVAKLVVSHKPAEAIAKAERLLKKREANQPAVRLFLYNRLDMAYQQVGDLALSNNYATKAKKIGEEHGIATNAHMTLFENMLKKYEYERLRKECGQFLSDLNKGRIPLPSEAKERKGARKVLEEWVSYVLAYANILTNRLTGVSQSLKNIIDNFSQNRDGAIAAADIGLVFELMGFLSRLKGKFEDARTYYFQAIEIDLTHGIARAVFPCARVLELWRFKDQEPLDQEIIERCKQLAENNGNWGGSAAVKEINALTTRDESLAANTLLEAAEEYLNTFCPHEAFLTSLGSAQIGWETDDSCFFKATKFLRPLMPFFPIFRDDPIFGHLFKGIAELQRILYQTDEHAIKAHLIDEFKVWVDGEEITLRSWGERKAILALIYLLLNEKHRIAGDHLSYLLWSCSNHRKRMQNLYRCISLIRKRLDIKDRGLLINNGGFYQLMRTWTDLEELENLVRFADATQDPDQKQEYLARARELARGELLPEYPYDRHIDEYRQHYKRLRRRLKSQ